MSLPKKIALGVALLLCVGAGALFYLNGKDNYDPSKYEAKVSDGLNEGSLVNLTLPDQFEKSHTVDESVKLLVFAFSKTTGGAIRGFLDKQTPSYLRDRNAHFIADISSLPVVIRNSFALPKLRKSEYPVLLVYEAEMAKSLMNPEQRGKICIAHLEQGVVTSVSYINGEAALEKAINEEPRPL